MTEFEKLQQENAELKQRLEKYEKPKSIFEMRLKQARVSAGLTQEKIAKRLLVAPQNYAAYEQGRREPKATSLLKIADALNVSLDWLCGRTDKMSGV